MGLRLARWLAQVPRRARIVATTRRGEQAAAIRATGARVLAIDLDRRADARRIGGLAQWLVDLAPPPARGERDPRTRRWIGAVMRTAARRLARERGRDDVAAGLAPGADAQALRPARWAYVSTTGVYGDCAGATFDETRRTAPASDRARRRVDAERQVRAAVRRGLARASILRAPGIYAEDRLPIERLVQRTPALAPDDDVYTNHIHALDLARLAWLALLRGRAARVYHAVDDTALRMGDYFDRVADALALPRPPRLSRTQIAAQVSPAMLSFMSESRRLRNERAKRELRARLRYPTVDDTLRAALVAGRGEEAGSARMSAFPAPV